jgi:hypothetical protein
MEHTRDWGRLAALLLDAVGDRVVALGRPIWVQVLDLPDGDKDGENSAAGRFALAFSDAEDGLMGQVVGPDCQAVGVIGSGRVRPAPRAPSGPSGPSGPDRSSGSSGSHGSSGSSEQSGASGPTGDYVEAIRMVCLLTRAGEVEWRLSQADGSKPSLPISELPPSEGRLLDCLRRCFELPTSPPLASPARLQIIVWLVAALERAEGCRRPLSWSEVSRLHPVARLLAFEMEAPASDVSAITDALTRMGAAAYSWEDVRIRAARHEGFLDEVVDPHLAGWMDDGMFARWVLAELPSVDELFTALRPRLTPSAARRLAHAVHAADTTQTAVVT